MAQLDETQLRRKKTTLEEYEKKLKELKVEKVYHDPDGNAVSIDFSKDDYRTCTRKIETLSEKDKTVAATYLRKIYNIQTRFDNFLQKHAIKDKKSLKEITDIIIHMSAVEIAPIPKIVDRLKKEYPDEQSIGKVLVRKIIANNVLAIKERREEVKYDFSDIELSYKKARLLELQGLYEFTKESYYRDELSHQLRNMLSILDNIKKEVEGDSLEINMNIQQTLNVHLQQEDFKSLNIFQMVLAKVSGRLGLNPAYFMAKLEQSIYSKYNSQISGINAFRENNKTNMESEFIFLSDTVEISNLEQKAIAQQKENTKLLEKNTLTSPPIPAEDNTIVEKFKQSLLDGLKKKK